eukprot:CFRG2635T1
MIGVVAMRGVGMLATFLVGMGGLLVFPLKSLSTKTMNTVIGYFNAFGAGVMISIGLIHLLHEANQDLGKYYTFPMAFFLAGVGYGIIYFCEDVLLVEIVNSFSLVLQGSNYEVHSHGPTRRSSHSHLGELYHSAPRAGLGHRISLATGNTAATGNMAVSSYGHDHTHTPIEEESSENDKLLRGGHTPDDDLKPPVVNQKNMNDMRSTFVAFALQLVLSVHAIFEGLGLGASSTAEDMLPILLAILAHKGVEAFVIGSAFLKSSISKRRVVMLMTLFALGTPAGITLGQLVSSGDVSHIRGIVVSLSAGSFIYVGSLLLEDEDHIGDCHDLKKVGSKTRFCLWVLGFGLFALYSYVRKHHLD